MSYEVVLTVIAKGYHIIISDIRPEDLSPQTVIGIYRDIWYPFGAAKFISDEE